VGPSGRNVVITHLNVVIKVVITPVDD